MGTTDKIITLAAWVRANNKSQIIIMGHGDSLSYFILSWGRLITKSDVPKREGGVIKKNEIDFQMVAYLRGGRGGLI